MIGSPTSYMCVLTPFENEAMIGSPTAYIWLFILDIFFPRPGQHRAGVCSVMLCDMIPSMWYTRDALRISCQLDILLWQGCDTTPATCVSLMFLLMRKYSPHCLSGKRKLIFNLLISLASFGILLWHVRDRPAATWVSVIVLLMRKYSAHCLS